MAHGEVLKSTKRQGLTREREIFEYISVSEVSHRIMMRKMSS